MSDEVKPTWYRSLYWRIGLGFVLFLALVVSAQAAGLLWLISRMEVAPGPPPPSVTRLVADELSAELEADPQLDIEQFFRQQYEERLPVFAVLRDGRVISSTGASPPADLVAEARDRLRGRGQGFGPDPGPGRGRRGGGPPLVRGRATASPIVVDRQVVGLVVANPQSAWQQLGPTLLIVGLLLVGAGTTSAALLIFGPVRRRIRSLEDSARKVGGGDLTARAREDGGDEVAALARTFNRMTADLAVRADQLQSADRQRRLLLADVSHELMTPLTAMRGYLETLAMSGLALDEDTRARYLSIIGDETRRLEHIVGDLLDLARMESPRERVDRQDVPLEDLFGRVVARHQREAASKDVALTTSIAPGAEIVTGDPMRLEQALQNLAANALRHTPQGGRIELGAELDGHDVLIGVHDTGSGIAPEHLPHVFDRFYKADPSRGVETGSGLGLSIVKAIIERHGGTISASSRAGEGTNFTIRLPQPPG